MSTAAKNYGESPHPAELHSGDHMTREEFHRAYVNMPEDFKAELVGGIVYVSSPLKLPHGKHHLCFATALGIYQGKTPGVEAGDNATVVLSDDDEPQPDLFMRIRPDFGGQSGDTTDEYIKGPPELIAEVAHSSWAIDLHSKRERYEKAGVLEYIVLCIEPKEVRWFDFRAGHELMAGTDDVLHSQVFPGLWIHAESLLQLDFARLMDVLQQGTSSAEHGEFVARLAKQQKK